ncbi:MAG: hypothetical protein ACJ72N_03555 [Labedaea sp.]
MAISPVYNIAPVYDVASILSQGGVSGGGIAPGPIVNPPTSTTDPAFVTFKRLGYGQGLHGGPVPIVVASVTLAATVTPSGSPRREAASGAELRDRSRIVFKIVTSENPSTYFDKPLATDDQVDWAGDTLSIVGKPYPQGTSFETLGEMMA